MTDEDAMDETTEEETPPELPDVKVSITKHVEVDASLNLGNGKRLIVKSLKSGLKVGYSRKVKNNYYGYRTETDYVVVPEEFVGNLYDIIGQVIEAKEEN